jgi:hypothetical protein
LAAPRVRLKRKTVEQILVEPIDDERNPLVPYGLYAEEQQRSFDSTCGNSPAFRVPKQEERAAIISYLKSLSTP